MHGMTFFSTTSFLAKTNVYFRLEQMAKEKNRKKIEYEMII
jgi:hypothetical protein